MGEKIMIYRHMLLTVLLLCSSPQSSLSMDNISEKDGQPDAQTIAPTSYIRLSISPRLSEDEARTKKTREEARELEKRALNAFKTFFDEYRQGVKFFNGFLYAKT